MSSKGLRQVKNRVLNRLSGAPHFHTDQCIHNLPPDTQKEMRGFTPEQWVKMGIPEPEYIGPNALTKED